MNRNVEDTPRQTIRELNIGIFIHGCIFMILGIIFMRPVWLYAIALVIGLIGASVLVYSMYTSLDRALNMNSDKARSFATLHAFLRLGGACALMIIGMLIDWTAFVGVAVGLIGLKVSAFLNPLIKKYLRCK